MSQGPRLCSEYEQLARIVRMVFSLVCVSFTVAVNYARCVSSRVMKAQEHTTPL